MSPIVSFGIGPGPGRRPVRIELRARPWRASELPASARRAPRQQSPEPPQRRPIEMTIRPSWLEPVGGMAVGPTAQPAPRRRRFIPRREWLAARPGSGAVAPRVARQSPPAMAARPPRRTQPKPRPMAGCDEEALEKRFRRLEL